MAGAASTRRSAQSGHAPYALRGCVWCGVCERRMQSHWVNDAPYYRCRFPAEYALATKIEHPLNSSFGEAQIIGQTFPVLMRAMTDALFHCDHVVAFASGIAFRGPSVRS
jgi:hypothetical protein